MTRDPMVLVVCAERLTERSCLGQDPCSVVLGRNVDPAARPVNKTPLHEFGVRRS